MNGLEALEELKFQVGNITYYTRDLKETTFKVKDSGLFEILEKELKALEIIKNKVLPYIDTLEPFTKMTREEWKILKEALDNESSTDD